MTPVSTLAWVRKIKVSERGLLIGIITLLVTVGIGYRSALIWYCELPESVRQVVRSVSDLASGETRVRIECE